MRALRFLVSLVLGSLVAACSADPAVGAGTCSSTAECGAGEMCVDGRCRPRRDGGPGIDGGSLPDGAPRDVARADVVCAFREDVAMERRRPIDAIILPDESGSMGPARDSVALAMETTFRTTMEGAGIDYHVIWHGTTPLPMIEATGRLTRNPVLLGSGTEYMFRPVLDTYDAWRPALRVDAIKVFIHFTDATSSDGSSIGGYSGMFDEVLVAREPAVWGTAGAYQFSYHTFIGMNPNTPPEAPYEPADPVVGGGCGGPFSPAPPLEEMALRTGGLRFPLCFFDRFDAVFRRIADSAIDRARIACEIEIPDPPEGMTLDVATLAVRYRDGSGAVTVLRRAMSAAECSATGFLVEGDRVVLCPEACAVVEGDPAATLTVLSGCDPSLY